MTRLEQLLEQIPTAVLLERLEVDGIANIDEDDVERTEEQFIGVFDDAASFAAQYLEDTGLLGEVPKALEYYIDFDGWAHDAEISGDVQYIYHGPDVYVFHNHH
jgi:antirestriction protein